MLKARSALIVTLPIPRGLETIRCDNVPVASLGVPSHVTILSPSLPAGELQPSVRRRLVEIAAGHPAFDVTFARVERFPGALYLAPQPNEPFRELSVAVVRAFPGYPPYGEPTYRPEDGVPHLTFAMPGSVSFDDLAAAARPPPAVHPQGPFHDRDRRTAGRTMAGALARPAGATPLDRDQLSVLATWSQPSSSAVRESVPTGPLDARQSTVLRGCSRHARPKRPRGWTCGGTPRTGLPTHQHQGGVRRFGNLLELALD